ncbi:hypothetical protein, partial [Tardiphaga sp.]|uniref:hypothetical protein n=1 Tax=Tardiphaga sp. TaxID=1926292 RepID=UPI0037DA3124
MSNRLAELTERIALIRLHKKTIAIRCGLDESTIGRTLKGQTVPLSSTLDKIEDVVAAEEALIAEHLNKRGAA